MYKLKNKMTMSKINQNKVILHILKLCITKIKYQDKSQIFLSLLLPYGIAKWLRSEIPTIVGCDPFMGRNYVFGSSWKVLKYIYIFFIM